MLKEMILLKSEFLDLANWETQSLISDLRKILDLQMEIPNEFHTSFMTMSYMTVITVWQTPSDLPSNDHVDRHDLAFLEKTVKTFRDFG